MAKDNSKPFSPPAYDADEKSTEAKLGITPLNDGDGPDRGRRAQEGSGAVSGSGAGAGGTAVGKEDYDEDSAGGGGAGSPHKARSGGDGVTDDGGEDAGRGDDLKLPPNSSSM
jgi:hypothetical protein